MPRLIVTRGKNLGSHSVEEELTLGRKDADVIIAELGASRDQAEILKRGDAYVIRDLDSKNGTFVDGKRVKEAVLKDGSRISVADWEAIFKDECDGDSDVTWFEHDDDRAATTSTLSTKQQGRAAEVLHVADPHLLHRRIKLLDDIGALIHSRRDAGDLLNEIGRQCLLAFADCHSCVVVFKGPDADTLNIKSALLRTKEGVEPVSEPEAHLCLSRTIIKRALEKRESIHRSDVLQDTALKGVKSIVDLGIHAFLCAPLIRGDEAFGVIYLDSRRPNAKLGEADLRLLSAIANEAALAIENAELHQELKLAKECLEEENRRFRQEMGDEFLFDGIIGSSPAMRGAIEAAEKAAQTDASVLITGEPGVGKELFARAIHYNSRRCGGPFEDFNCAVEESLIDSELFGVESAAFTSVKARPGLFERADGGTVFLDEIGNMPLSSQAKMLRVLEQREVRRMGGSKLIKVDVRIVAATNEDLAAKITDGGFRRDLYGRFAVVTINVPPLRERREDILRLAEYFLTKFSFKYGKDIEGFSLPAQQALTSYSWKDANVRGLRNEIERIVTLENCDALVNLKNLSKEIAQAGAADAPIRRKRGPLREVLAEVEKEVIIEKLKETDGKIKRAARELGVSQQGLRNKIDEYDLWGIVEEARGTEKA